MATMRKLRPEVRPLPVVVGRPPATFTPSPKSTRGFTYQWIDYTQVNPVLEQPRLDFTSAAQPFIRWGHRRIVRTNMAATPPFGGRYAFVGFLMNQFLERNKMSGQQSRGFTYAYQGFQPGPGPSRTVRLRAPAVGR